MVPRICEVPKFKRKQVVVAVEDLPGVPVGTVGQVYYEAGITWFRYHVAFENGVNLANVNGDSLVTKQEWAQLQYDQRVASLEAEREARRSSEVVTFASGRH